MTRTTKLFGELWTRFERYEIVDGYIRPAPKARQQEYDPWEDYEPLRGKASTVRPYHSLIALSERIEGRDDPFRPLEQEYQDQIVSWCESNGLLGILLHRTEMVTLPQDPKEHLPKTVRYLRTTRGWQTVETLFEWPPSSEFAGVLLRDIGSVRWHVEPLSQTWAEFFPDVAERQEYLMPRSPEFWTHYAEPLGRFIETARTLRKAVAGLRLIENLDARSKIDLFRWRQASTTMDALTSTVQPLLYDRSDDTYGLGWHCHSLLSVLAMMASLDFVSGRQLQCPECRRMFVSQAQQAEYCSPRCRATAQMRRYRKNKAQEKQAQSKRRSSDGKKKTRSKRR